MKKTYSEFIKFLKVSTLSFSLLSLTAGSAFSQCFTVSSSSGNVTCNGACDGFAAVKAIGGSGSFIYSWTTGGSGLSVSGLCPNTYTVAILDAVNTTCSTAVIYTITEPSVIITTISSQNATCGQANGTATVFATGGTGAFNYTWSNSATGQTASGLMAASYIVTIKDANGCPKTDAVVINNISGPNVSTSVTPATCGSSNGAISATISGGTPSYTYLWSNSATTSIISNLPAATYVLTVTDANGCSIVSNAVVNCVTGINENNNGLFMNLSPNPSNSSFVLESRFDKADKTVIHLTNILGEIVMLIDTIQQVGTYKKQVNIEQLSDGIYFLVVQQNNERYVKKVIVQ